jgi:hypothetical protein
VSSGLVLIPDKQAEEWRSRFGGQQSAAEAPKQEKIQLLPDVNNGK